MCAYIIFNYAYVGLRDNQFCLKTNLSRRSACFLFVYLVTIYDWSSFSVLPKKKAEAAPENPPREVV